MPRIFLVEYRSEFENLQVRHKAQTVAQLRDFVGKLGGLQNLHQSLKLRMALYQDKEYTFISVQIPTYRRC